MLAFTRQRPWVLTLSHVAKAGLGRLRHGSERAARTCSDERFGDLGGLALQPGDYDVRRSRSGRPAPVPVSLAGLFELRREPTWMLISRAPRKRARPYPASRMTPS
jgi:hypothetical protein